MADELHEISSGTSPQDILIDHAVTQPLQVNIQVPDTANVESSNIVTRFFWYIFGLIIIFSIRAIFYYI